MQPKQAACLLNVTFTFFHHYKLLTVRSIELLPWVGGNFFGLISQVISFEYCIFEAGVSLFLETS
jgi:hypothetical protein